MPAEGPEPRALAKRVAKVLRDKGNSADAVLVLSAWAASGPNDADGQALLAEALRIEPKSDVAKMAFERMEGLSGEHAELDQAMARFTLDELARLDRQYRPVFQRAQVGFNNNVKYKGKPTTCRPRTRASVTRTSSRTCSPTAVGSSRATSGATPTLSRGTTSSPTCAPS
jgi:hypothetical protein